jgi:hypothetical protein
MTQKPLIHRAARAVQGGGGGSVIRSGGIRLSSRDRATRPLVGRVLSVAIRKDDEMNTKATALVVAGLAGAALTGPVPVVHAQDDDAWVTVDSRAERVRDTWVLSGWVKCDEYHDGTTSLEFLVVQRDVDAAWAEDVECDSDRALPWQAPLAEPEQFRPGQARAIVVDQSQEVGDDVLVTLE